MIEAIMMIEILDSNQGFSLFTINEINPKLFSVINKKHLLKFIILCRLQYSQNWKYLIKDGASNQPKEFTHNWLMFFFKFVLEFGVPLCHTI
jgi:hypothetical protein